MCLQLTPNNVVQYQWKMSYVATHRKHKCPDEEMFEKYAMEGICHGCNYQILLLLYRFCSSRLTRRGSSNTKHIPLTQAVVRQIQGVGPGTGAVQTRSLRSDSDAGQHDVHSDGDER